MARSREYWEERFADLEEAQSERGAEYFAELEKQYKRASASVQRDIERWYARFADNNEISIQEARKLLSGNDLEEFRWNVMDYIEKGRTLNISDQWARQLENASARVHISRLEAIKLQMQNHVEVLYGNEMDEFSEVMREIYTEGYYHTAYEIQKGFNIGYDLMRLDSNKVEKVLSRPWAADGSNFSDRIWKQKSQLVSELHNNLTQAIMRGQNPHAVTEAIAKRFNVSRGQAGRLVMTESAFFNSASNRDCYKDLGVEQFEILATLDKHTSDICQSLDGKVFPMSEYAIGVTAPPFHVWCRTTTVPFFDDEFELGSERTARDEDGKTYYVPSDMKYEDWKNTFVDGGSKKDLNPIEKVMEDDIALEEAAEPTNIIEFTPAKSIKEAEEFISKYVDTNVWGGTGISYKGISVDSANAINETLNELFSTYDLNKLGGVYVAKGNTKLGKAIQDATAAYSPIRQSLLLNNNALNDIDSVIKGKEEELRLISLYKSNPDGIKFKTKRAEDVARASVVSGRATVPDDIRDVINHEMGHSIEGVVSRNDNYAVVRERMSEYAEKISGYATINEAEYIAESFASYQKGENLIDPELAKIFDSLKQASNEVENVLESATITIQPLNYFNTSNIATVYLPKDEYAHVISEINTHMSDEQRAMPVVSKAIGDYIYTFENYGFNEYRIIDKRLIEGDIYEEIQRIYDE